MDKLQDTTVKSIRMEKELVNKIEKLASENERNFNQQVRLMLKNYIEIIEKK